MGNWDFKTTPGWHWENVKLGGRARFRVKDGWIEDTPLKEHLSLMYLVSGEAPAGRSFRDATSDHYLYISECQMSHDQSFAKIINKLSSAIGHDNAVHLFSIAPSNYSYIGRESRPNRIDSTFFNFILTKDWDFSRLMPNNGSSLTKQLNDTLYFDSESWNFHTLAINDEVVTYSFYIGPGTGQEMSIYSRFWGMDSNTGSNYFFNSIEI